MKAGLLGKTKSMHGHHHHHHPPPKPHGAGERLCFGLALERGGEQVYRVPLAGEFFMGAWPCLLVSEQCDVAGPGVLQTWYARLDSGARTRGS